MMFFVLNFGPRTNESFSLSLSLFFSLLAVRLVFTASLSVFFSPSLSFTLSLSLFPFPSSQSLLVLLCRSSSLS